MSGRFSRFASLVFGVGLFLFVGIPRANAAAHNVSGWAWSGTLGWISVDCNSDPTGCTGAGGDYGLDLDDQGNLSGWAWSSNAGWICFGATCDGAVGAPPAGTPSSPADSADHYCPGFVPCALYDTNDHELHGWAYVLSQTDGTNYRGWISLNCTDVGTNTASPRDCGSSDYGVTYAEDATPTNGEMYGYAWNGNGDDTGSGWIKFGCGEPHSSCGAPGSWGVISTWIATGWVDLKPIEGVYSPSPPPTVGSHLTDIKMTFTDFSAPQDSVLRCVFQTSDGTRRDLSWPITQRYTLEPEFTVQYTVTGSDAVTDAQGNPVLWSYGSAPPDVPFGCELQATPPDQRVVSNLVAVHPSDWTFSGPEGADAVDAVRARYCLEGNVNTDPSKAYFLNTDPEGNVVQCDTEGDLAFTLLKARGVPVEVYCYDDADDEGNLQADCAGSTLAPTPDRNCRGITYLCIPHPAASAPQTPLP